MKVHIGKYKNWYTPYHVTDKIPFVSDETREKIGDWIVESPIQKLFQWFNNFNDKRKIEIHIDRWDTWNMDHTLALIILPMLKQLKATKHGSPYVDDEDLPEHMRHSDPRSGEWGPDNWIHYKWEWILNEMIFAFEHTVDDSWENQFFHESEFDKEGFDAMQKRVANGHRLFGKYYSGLWD